MLIQVKSTKMGSRGVVPIYLPGRLRALFFSLSLNSLFWAKKYCHSQVHSFEKLGLFRGILTDLKSQFIYVVRILLRKK